MGRWQVVARRGRSFLIDYLWNCRCCLSLLLSEHVLPGWLVGCQAKVVSEIFKCLRAFHTGPVTPTEGALRAHMRGGGGQRHRSCVSITDLTTKTHLGTNKTTSLLFHELFNCMHVSQWLGLLPHNSWFKPWLLPSCVEFACYHCPCVSLCGQWLHAKLLQRSGSHSKRDKTQKNKSKYLRSINSNVKWDNNNSGIVLIQFTAVLFIQR